ncbi:MAG TPA: amino acid permease [Pyrinomonadaceae bacterium]|jgi:APA family basic amino acid/polyamine antiporter|nr:amino acid permease [Pyrinomonadaceae bacterium]
MSVSKNQLVRGLSLVAAISIVIGNVIGTGVFLKARVMTCNVGTPKMVLLVYVVAGLLSLAGALSYAELAAMMPKAGGEYVFMREAYGRRWSFLFGWMSFFIGKAGSQAALGVQFALFLNIMIGGSLAGEFFSTTVLGHPVPFGKLQVVALLAILIVTGINCLAVKVSGGVATVLSGIKIALVLLVGIGAFLFARSADWSHLLMANVGGTCEGVSAAARFGFGGFIAAMLGALWAYDGWNNVTLVAGEVQNPGRNLPRALIGGTLLIMALYLLANVAYFYALSPTEIASISTKSSVATEVAKQFLGPLAISFIAAALLSSTFGTLHTSILTGARVPYAMARDGLFMRSLSRVSPRTHVPTGALIVQAIWACILVIAFSSSFDTLTDYAIFGLWIFYGLVTAAVFILRRKMPEADRPYRAWGYPVVPVLFLLATALILGTTLVAARADFGGAVTQMLHGQFWSGLLVLLRNPPIAGIGLIALGLPVYWLWERRAKR